MRYQHHRHIVIGYAEQDMFTFIVAKVGTGACVDQHLGNNRIIYGPQNALRIPLLCMVSHCPRFQVHSIDLSSLPNTKAMVIHLPSIGGLIKRWIRGAFQFT